ncbi:hypothetical protein B566_EDAN005138 [Ephemera danica]|nr:hypothetical protein B566_EDAN005138 [Ephemera danica]
MVMEETPSPHCVGREFVRQYYTLLNQAPMHLHRFYNENSSFVHGGLDTPNRETKPVIGQRQIHHRIQQLEFNDCHAKIRQVDSQATLGNGVVVQVTGELSNNGEPMRRFTQTFVLAQQSPKKYYVHNDIFRYQDEMVADEECEPDSGRSEAEEDLDDVQGEATVGVTVSQPVPPTFYMSPAPSQQQQQPPPSVQLPTVAPVAAAAAIPVNTMTSTGLNGSAVTEEVTAPGPTATPALVTPSVVSNASVAVKLEADEADADDEAEEVVSKVPEVAPQPEQDLPGNNDFVILFILYWKFRSW